MCRRGVMRPVPAGLLRMLSAWQQSVVTGRATSRRIGVDVMTHTKEPWFVKFDQNIYGADGYFVALSESGDNDHADRDSNKKYIDRGMEAASENAIRIVACVNACAGIETEQLEKDIAVGGEKAIFDSLAAKIEALKQWQQAVRNSSPLLCRAEKAERQLDELLSNLERVVKIQERTQGNAAQLHAAMVDVVFDLREAIAKAKGGAK